MTDAERVVLIRDVVNGKVSPAAMVEAIKSIVGERLAVPVSAAKCLERTKTPDFQAKSQKDSNHYEENQPQDRFVTLPELCKRAGYQPRTVHNYRARGLSHKLKLPNLIKRGDGRLGCLESVLNKYLLEQYGTIETDKSRQL